MNDSVWTNRKKLYLNLLFVAVIFFLTLWLVFRGEDPGDVAEYLSEADPRFVLLSILCVIFFILGESVIINYLMRTLGQPVRFFHCCLYSFIGFFFSCITPSASGGQPMQVVAMHRDEIPVPVATVVLAIVTITYKLVLVVIGCAVFLIRPSRIMACLEPVEGVMVLGIVLNVACITLLLMLVFHPHFVKVAAARLMEMFCRIRPMRHPERQMERLERLTDQYHGTAEFYRTHRHVMVQVFLITFLQRICLFLVTWFTYLAFGLPPEQMTVILILQAMISVASDMLPLPGGMGVSESLFLVIFLPFFGEELILPAMVLSRGIGYYTQLLISALMTAASSFILKRDDGKRKEFSAT